MSTFFTFLCLSLIFLSDSAAFFCLNCCLKNAGVSFDRWRFQVFYGVSIVLEVFLGQTVSQLTTCIAMKVRRKLTPHYVTRHLSSSHAVCLTNILPSSCSFFRRRSPEWTSKIFKFLHLSIGKVLVKRCANI